VDKQVAVGGINKYFLVGCFEHHISYHGKEFMLLALDNHKLPNAHVFDAFAPF
jgi:hypothetical protein